MLDTISFVLLRRSLCQQADIKQASLGGSDTLHCNDSVGAIQTPDVNTRETMERRKQRNELAIRD